VLQVIVDLPDCLKAPKADLLSGFSMQYQWMLFAPPFGGFFME
jgi:hypothetical protein